MPKGEGDLGREVALAAPRLCPMLGASGLRGTSPQNHFREPWLSSTRSCGSVPGGCRRDSILGLLSPSLPWLHEATGRNWDKTHVSVVQDPPPWACQQGCSFFSPLASLLPKPGSKAAPRGSPVGRRQLPALCLGVMAGCLLRAGYRHFGDAATELVGFSPGPRPASVSPVVKQVRGRPVPTLAGKWLLCLFGKSSSGEPGIAAALERLPAFQSKPTRARARTSKQPLRASSQRCCRAPPRSLPHRSRDKPQ